VKIDGEKQSVAGRTFHMVVASNSKERWPEVECMRGACRKCLLEERVAHVVLRE